MVIKSHFNTATNYDARKSLFYVPQPSSHLTEFFRKHFQCPYSWLPFYWPFFVEVTQSEENHFHWTFPKCFMKHEIGFKFMVHIKCRKQALAVSTNSAILCNIKPHQISPFKHNVRFPRQKALEEVLKNAAQSECNRARKVLIVITFDLCCC